MLREELIFPVGAQYDWDSNPGCLDLEVLYLLSFPAISG